MGCKLDIPSSPNSSVLLALLIFVVAPSLLEYTGGALLTSFVAPASSSDPAPAERNVIVIAHYDEDLTWAFDFASDARDDVATGSRAWNIAVHAKQASRAVSLRQEALARGLAPPTFRRGHAYVSVFHETADWGYEAVSYLRHIVNNYDSLPPLLLFVHGAPFGHAPDIGHVVECVNPQFSGYYPLGYVYVSNYTTPTDGNPLYRPLLDQFNKNLAASSLPQAPWTLQWNSHGWYAFAQFLVSRTLIRTRPRSYWVALLDAVLNVRGVWAAEILNGEAEGKVSAFWLEFSWQEHMTGVRGEPWWEYNNICGEEKNSAAPLLRQCCEADAHVEFLTIHTSGIHKRQVGLRTWLRHIAHKPWGSE